MKRSFSVPALCAAARNHFRYQIKDDRLFLIDRRCYFGLMVEGVSLLEELESRPRVKLEPAACADTFLRFLREAADAADTRDTGILIPRHKSLCRVLRPSGKHQNNIILINGGLWEPFHPVSIMGSSKKSPVFLFSPDCVAVLMPVNYDSKKLPDSLLALDDALNN